MNGWEADPGTEVITSVKPLWSSIGGLGLFDPQTRLSMYSYREAGGNIVPTEMIAAQARHAGFTDEQGNPTADWRGAYQKGFVTMAPRQTQPVDMGQIFGGGTWRVMTETERDRADILPYIPGISSLGETQKRIEEGKFWTDIKGMIKWAAILGGIGLLGYVVVKEILPYVVVKKK